MKKYLLLTIGLLALNASAAIMSGTSSASSSLMNFETINFTNQLRYQGTPINFSLTPVYNGTNTAGQIVYVKARNASGTSYTLAPSPIFSNGTQIAVGSLTVTNGAVVQFTGASSLAYRTGGECYGCILTGQAHGEVNWDNVLRYTAGGPAFDHFNGLIYAGPSTGASLDAQNGLLSAAGTITYWKTSTPAIGDVSDAIATTSFVANAVESGIFTPTLTNVTNVAASTPYQCQFMRVGNVVTVSGKIDIDVTLAASADTEVGMTLPRASDFSAEENLGGGASSDALASLIARIKADPTNDRASIVFKALSLSNDSYSFTFTYYIQ